MRLVKHFVEAAKNYLENCRRNQSLTQEHSKTIRKESHYPIQTMTVF